MKKIGNNKGFTLIELIVVLVALGILTAAVLSRGMNSEQATLRSQVDTLKGHLRYAQYLAMNDMEPTRWGIAISGSSYTLVRSNGSSQISVWMSDPGITIFLWSSPLRLLFELRKEP